jgi:MoxR-like ATPase
MTALTPDSLATTLETLVREGIKLSAMIWGPPGIGKSATVRSVATGLGIALVDLRISQLAPTDLRGLPVPDGDVARWLPPEFLPREGRGILFLDEINLAPPAIQGIAQQLVLDRRVGSYNVPDEWFVWAAGNRREDRAASFDMPAPLANRFLHFELEPDITGFLRYAARNDFAPEIVAFLGFRAELLHKLDPSRPAWPSPRSWEMASRLRKARLSVASAVGAPAATELEAFVAVLHQLPDLEQILRGQAAEVAFPEEPSQRYAVALGLAQRVGAADEALAAFRWLARRTTPEWIRIFLVQAIERLKTKRAFEPFVTQAMKDADLVRFLKEYRELSAGS